MPEIAEVERARTILDQVLKDQTVIDVEAFDDAIVFKDTTAEEFVTAVKGKKVVCAKRWGKYFWIQMESPPHPVLHFGMTGWVRVRGAPSHYYSTEDENEWPPRFVKFILKIAEPKTKPSLEGSLIPEIWGTEIAFVDARRLGRVRLVDAEDPFTVAPLNELGFDPILKMPEFEWFAGTVVKRKVPIKALLLDQSFSAGVGNWVADEVLYQAAIHPEQYSNTLPKSALKTLHEKIHSVTTVAAAVLGDSSKFPKDWLFSYRWGKGTRGKKGGKGENNVLPNGEKIIHITVGGRTSAVVESRQKKIRANGEEEDEVEKKPVKKKGAVKDEEGKASKKLVKGKESPATKKAEKVVEEEEATPKKRRSTAKVEEEVKEEEATPKKRRVGGKAANGTPKSTPTRQSSRSKA